MSGVKATKLESALAWQSTLKDYVTGLSWSPEGSLLAVSSASGEVLLFDESGHPQRLRAADGQAINCLEFSANGQFLAAGGQAGTLVLWPLSAPQQPLMPMAAVEGSSVRPWIDQLQWHPQKTVLAYGLGTQAVLWSAESHSSLAELNFLDSSVLSLDWHPQGERIAIAGHGGLKVWSEGAWTAEPTVIAVPGASLHVAWSADGRYIASGNLDRTLTVAEWGSPPPWLMQGFPGKVRQLAWATPLTPSGSPLIAAACMEGITLWERRKAGGSWQSLVLQHHRDRVNGIAFQGHSRLLASAGQDGQVALWQEGHKRVHAIKGFQAGVSCLRWHPSGEQLAIGGTAGELKVFRLSHFKQGFG